MKLSIAVSDEEEEEQEQVLGQDFEDFKPSDNLEEDLKTPKIEHDDDFAAQVNAGMESQQFLHTQRAADGNVTGNMDNFLEQNDYGEAAQNEHQDGELEIGNEFAEYDHQNQLDDMYDNGLGGVASHSPTGIDNYDIHVDR